MANKKTIQFNKTTLRAAIESDTKESLIKAVLTACLDYDDMGEIPEFDDIQKTTLFQVLRLELDEARERYEEIREKRSKAGKISAEKRAEVKHNKC